MHTTLFEQLSQSVGISPERLQSLQLSFTGNVSLPSCFQTTALASSSFMAAAVALAEFDTGINKIKVDNRLASLWFQQSLVPLDWDRQGLWDSIAGDYACANGWIRLHTNAPHHKLAALSVLNCDEMREAVAVRVSNSQAGELEQAIVEAGSCAAEMRSLAQWQQHPQGIAVAKEPLIIWDTQHEVSTCSPGARCEKVNQPLSGLRVLDLTRVLAGPISTRFLAAYGADVLRIDPEHWDEPGVVPEVTLGKRCAHLDLKSALGRDQFVQLIKTADVLIHGYRPGAMSGLGLDEGTLRTHNPELITVSLCAYGWTGPWSQRRGFDSLVQMSSGIAQEGMKQYRSDKPHPLPVQALDHATGYLMAAAALHALACRRDSGVVTSARLSLARTAHLLQCYPQDPIDTPFEATTAADLHPHIEQTAWGRAQRVQFPVEMDTVQPHWQYPAGELRSFDAQWL